jgi:hypothetical protein
VFRVLRPGGRHVFTVPFHHDRADDVVRAEVAPNGTLTHHLPPEHHIDPLRPGGALVYTDFGREMLDRLRELGFEVAVHELGGESLGLIGAPTIVFEASRPEAAVDPLPSGAGTVTFEVSCARDLFDALADPRCDEPGTAVVIVDRASLDETPSLLAALEGGVQIVRGPRCTNRAELLQI